MSPIVHRERVLLGDLFGQLEQHVHALEGTFSDGHWWLAHGELTQVLSISTELLQLMHTTLLRRQAEIYDRE